MPSVDRPRNHGRHWRPSDIAMLFNRYCRMEPNFSAATIASEFGRTESAITKVLRGVLQVDFRTNIWRRNRWLDSALLELWRRYCSRNQFTSSVYALGAATLNARIESRDEATSATALQVGESIHSAAEDAATIPRIQFPTQVMPPTRVMTRAELAGLITSANRPATPATPILTRAARAAAGVTASPATPAAPPTPPPTRVVEPTQVPFTRIHQDTLVAAIREAKGTVSSHTYAAMMRAVAKAIGTHNRRFNEDEFRQRCEA